MARAGSVAEKCKSPISCTKAAKRIRQQPTRRTYLGRGACPDEKVPARRYASSRLGLADCARATTMSGMPKTSASPVIILRSEPPLPAFCMPFPIPPPNSDISILRLSVLRILTGQKGLPPVQTLTYSEQLKQMTIQAWRLRMLDLIQVQAGSVRGNDEVELGLRLHDEHKCSALEHGDEIVYVSWCVL